MSVTLLYGLFVIYMAIRISFAITYYKVRNNYSEWFYRRGEQISKGQGPLYDNQMDFDRWCKEQDELPISKDLNRLEFVWTNLYRLDKNSKIIGEIILAVCSLVGVFTQTSVYFAALPSFVILFNNILGWFEVQFPVGLGEATPPPPKRKKR